MNYDETSRKVSDLDMPIFWHPNRPPMPDALMIGSIISFPNFIDHMKSKVDRHARI